MVLLNCSTTNLSSQDCQAKKPSVNFSMCRLLSRKKLMQKKMKSPMSQGKSGSNVHSTYRTRILYQRKSIELEFEPMRARQMISSDRTCTSSRCDRICQSICIDCYEIRIKQYQIERKSQVSPLCPAFQKNTSRALFLKKSQTISFFTFESSSSHIADTPAATSQRIYTPLQMIRSRILCWISKELVQLMSPVMINGPNINSQLKPLQLII